MGRQNGQIPIEIRKLIIEHHKTGKSVREIGKIIKRSHSSVHNIIKRYKNNNQIENKTKKSNRKIFTEADERLIVRKIKKNPKLSAVKLTNEIQTELKKKAHPETVRNVLRKHGFHGRVARRKPYISKVNKNKRLLFAKNYIKKDKSFWKNVIFTDESKFNLYRSDGRTYVWRKVNTALDEKNIMPTVKHGIKSVMVWGCIGHSGPGNLEIIEGTMTQNVYISILKRNLKQSAEKLGILDRFYLYQDNDPKHKAHNSRMWTLFNCPHVMDVPPQSPDLNVIEHVWEHLERNLQNYQIKTTQDLENSIKAEWNKLEPAYCGTLVESMPRRLNAVVQNKGSSTKY